MGRRPLLGALIHLLLGGPAAAANQHQHSSLQDLVNLIQHSATGAAFEALPWQARLARNHSWNQRAPGAALSLLAVDSSAASSFSSSSSASSARSSSSSSSSARWYDAGAEDEPLLAELADRREVLESKFDEITNTTNSSNESWLGLSLTVGKKTRLELTEADYDHIIEDEQTMEDLASELQRIAGETAEIERHQLEFGQHLGLPDPTIDHFAVDDKVEIRISSGANAGKYVKAVITGYGARTNTYRVHIPSAKEGNKDMALVPASILRKDEEALRSGDFVPAATTYQAGEQAQVQLRSGRSDDWAKCTVRSNGTLPDTYNVHVGAAPVGHKDMTDVPSTFLRKFETNQLFGQYDVDGDGELSTQEFRIALKEKATNVKVTQEAKQNDEVQLFAPGEQAEVSETEAVKTTYVGCMVIDEGDLGDTYNIFIPTNKVGFQYLTNIPADRLRKIGEQKNAADQKVKLIPAFVDHEVIAPRGAFAHRWVPCQLKRKGKGNTYDVWILYGVLKGHNMATGIPAENLRLRKTCGPGYDDIFNGDVPGGDHFGRLKNHKETVADCAADCNRHWECLSFEFSAKTKECNLNKVSNPGLPSTGDEMFCRRKEVPKQPASLWEGLYIGQPLEYIALEGEHFGQWFPCTVAAFGAQPNTYNITVDFLTTNHSYTNFSDIPIQHLRHAQDKPVEAVQGQWTPPEGEAAMWVNLTDDSSSQPTEPREEFQNFFVTNTHLNSSDPGLMYRSEKQLNSTIGTGAFASWSSYVLGVDEGNGWVRVGTGNAYLPTFLDGVPVLSPRINGEAGEKVQVRGNDGLWVLATIRSPGDKPNTYNVRVLQGKAKYMDNLPVVRMRKEISAPSVVASTTTPQLLDRVRVSMTTASPEAAAVPLLESTSVAAPVVQTMAAPAPTPGATLDERVQSYVERLRQEGRERRARERASSNFAVAEEDTREFLIDNRLIKSRGPGISYRQSKRLEDNKGRSDVALWGSIVSGIYEGDGWIRVGVKYLPIEVKGIPVISQKVKGDAGELVKFEQEDGTWAHATIRSLGDWKDTFNLHVMDNAAGFDLDNVAGLQLRHELDPPRKARIVPLLETAEEEEAGNSAEEEAVLAAGDLGKDLPDGVFRPNMTAEVKINAGPQAGHWVMCLITDQGGIPDTYNLYVPSAPSAYRSMWSVPALALRKYGNWATGTDPVKINETARVIDQDGISGDIGESVEVARDGNTTGQWHPALILAKGSAPDTYDIRLPGLYGSHQDIHSVPGNLLRRSDIQVVIEEEPSYPVYSPGENAQVVVPGRDGKPDQTYNCTVLRKAEFTNTYDISVPGTSDHPGVHARFMRKLGIEAQVSTTTTTMPVVETPVLNYLSFFFVANAARAGLSPVISTLADNRKSQRTWLTRAGDWPSQCDAQDRAAFNLKLHEMNEVAKTSPQTVRESVPEECSKSRWQDADSGVTWDELAKCFQKAANVSTPCAFCGVKLLLQVAEGCLAKCQPMWTVCQSSVDYEKCPAKIARCADCLEGPADQFMRCSGMPNRPDFLTALGKVSKIGKATASSPVDPIQEAARQLSPILYDQTDQLVRAGQRVFLAAWEAVFK